MGDEVSWVRGRKEEIVWEGVLLILILHGSDSSYLNTREKRKYMFSCIYVYIYICLGVYTSQRADSTSGCVTWTAGGTLYAFPTGGFLAAECSRGGFFDFQVWMILVIHVLGGNSLGALQWLMKEDGTHWRSEIRGWEVRKLLLRLLDGKDQWLQVFWVGVRWWLRWSGRRGSQADVGTF